MSVSDEEMNVVRSIRQSFEMYVSGGGAVQANSNPFFITANGEFDLLKTAQLVIRNLDGFRAHKENIAKAEAAKHLQKAQAELAAAAKADGTDLA
jgi:hypothetical protein